MELLDLGVNRCGWKRIYLEYMALVNIRRCIQITDQLVTMVMIKNTEVQLKNDISREVTTNHKIRLNYSLSKNTLIEILMSMGKLFQSRIDLG